MLSTVLVVIGSWVAISMITGIVGGFCLATGMDLGRRRRRVTVTRLPDDEVLVEYPPNARPEEVAAMAKAVADAYGQLMSAHLAADTFAWPQTPTEE